MSDSIVFPNRTKRMLKAGDPVMGTMVVEIRQPSVMYILKNAGYDFAIIDMEHGTFSVETVADLSLAARHVGLTPLVRVPDIDYPYLARPLDAGAQGLMVPRIRSAEQVRQVVESVKYPPVGRRGCAFGRGQNNFQGGPLSETMSGVNEEVFIIIQIETRDALEDAEAIASVPGVDVLLVGPTDLSIDLGVPGQLDAPELTDAIERVIAVCADNNVTSGIQIMDLDWLVHWSEKGMKFLSSYSETTLLMQGGKAVTSRLQEALEAKKS